MLLGAVPFDARLPAAGVEVWEESARLELMFVDARLPDADVELRVVEVRLCVVLLTSTGEVEATIDEFGTKLDVDDEMGTLEPPGPIPKALYNSWRILLAGVSLALWVCARATGKGRCALRREATMTKPARPVRPGLQT